jgi:hypothetical protein
MRWLSSISDRSPGKGVAPHALVFAIVVGVHQAAAALDGNRSRQFGDARMVPHAIDMWLNQIDGQHRCRAAPMNQKQLFQPASCVIHPKMGAKIGQTQNIVRS